MMDTENVEIIKAMVKTGIGIGIVPYQAIAREVRAGQFFCARIDGHELRPGNGMGLRAGEPRAADDPRTADRVRRNQRTPAARAGQVSQLRMRSHNLS